MGVYISYVATGLFFLFAVIIVWRNQTITHTTNQYIAALIFVTLGMYATYNGTQVQSLSQNLNDANSLNKRLSDEFQNQSKIIDEKDVLIAEFADEVDNLSKELENRNKIVATNIKQAETKITTALDNLEKKPIGSVMISGNLHGALMLLRTAYSPNSDYPIKNSVQEKSEP